MRFRRSGPSEPGRPAIDDELWELVTAPVLAAQAGDPSAHHAAHLRWVATDLPIARRRRIELSGRFLLGQKLFTYLPRRDDGALGELALRLTPVANRLVRGTPDMYEAVFRTALGEPRDGDHLSAYEMDMFSTALLGALLGDDPATELAAMRPLLEAYYERMWTELLERETNGSIP